MTQHDTERQTKQCLMSQPTENLESEVRALAHRHLSDAKGSPRKLLRRLDEYMQDQEQLLSIYKKKEHLTDTVAELLKSGATTGIHREIESMVDRVTK